MIVCLTSEKEAEIRFLYLYLYVVEKSLRFVIDGALENKSKVDISAIKLYIPPFESIILTYEDEAKLLDPKSERNNFYLYFESEPNKKMIRLDKQEWLIAKECRPSMQEVEEEIQPISIDFVGNVKQGEVVFFRVKGQCFLPAIVTKLLKLLSIYQLDLKVYPNAYPDITELSTKFRREFALNAIEVKDFHLWVKIPLGYVFLDPPEPVLKEEDGCAIMFRDTELSRGRFIKTLKFMKSWQYWIMRHKGSILTLIALTISLLSLILRFVYLK